MEASFVSRARTAINSAAAKAEKVFTDIKKSDSNAHRESEDLDKQSHAASAAECSRDADESEDSEEAVNNKRGRPQPIKTKQDWHEKFRNLRLGKKGAEDSGKPENSTMAYAIFDDNLYMMNEREFSQSNDFEEEELESSKAAKADIIPSSAILRQLAVAIEAGSGYSSMKDLLASSKSSSPIREKASMSISVMKSLVLREKDDKMINELGSDDKVLALLNALNAEGEFTGRTLPCLETQINTTSLVKDIHGAPLESFLVKLSEAISCLKTLRKMASFWSRVVSEIRRLWYDGQYIPGIPPGDLPDLNSCLLYQQLQVINCCISRKRRQTAALESLESITAQADATCSSDSERKLPLDCCFYAKTKSGELVLRLGADKRCENLTMLKTGEPVYSPVMQEPPLLTEDLIKETEEFVLRTGSVGAGCSQLLSDMQAFKAANPGCILEDFVRWHSPPDWMEDETSTDMDNTSEGGDLCSKGQLSMRMQKEGNLWRELWETSKPVPAVRQAPLYDEDLAVEGILDFLEVIPPSELLKQLFIVVLGAGLVIAEAMFSTNPNLSNIFNDCKNYIVVTCQSSTWVEKLDDICQVYDTVETMVHNQDEAINISAQPEETTTAGEVKNRFKKLTLIFGGKSKAPSKDLPKTEENAERQPFSIFSKKPPKPVSSPSQKPSGPAESEWTIV